MAGDCGLNALSLLPENVLPQWQQKIATQKMLVHPDVSFRADTIFMSFNLLDFGLLAQNPKKKLVQNFSNCCSLSSMLPCCRYSSTTRTTTNNIDNFG